MAFLHSFWTILFCLDCLVLTTVFQLGLGVGVSSSVSKLAQQGLLAQVFRRPAQRECCVTLSPLTRMLCYIITTNTRTQRHAETKRLSWSWKNYVVWFGTVYILSNHCLGTKCLEHYRIYGNIFFQILFGFGCDRVGSFVKTHTHWNTDTMSSSLIMIILVGATT